MPTTNQNVTARLKKHLGTQGDILVMQFNQLESQLCKLGRYTEVSFVWVDFTTSSTFFSLGQDVIILAIDSQLNVFRTTLSCSKSWQQLLQITDNTRPTLSTDCNNTFWNGKGVSLTRASCSFDDICSQGVWYTTGYKP